MPPWPVRKILRLLIRSTPHEKATRQIISERDQTLRVADQIGPDLVAKPTTVGFLPGIDPDMRGWSVAQILEHNTIVNNVFTDIVDHLLRGEIFVSDFDVKHGVMPSAGVGSEQIKLFARSVDRYLARIRDFSPAEMAATKPQAHPLFGPFTAKHWHAMFGFHLKLHRRQAEAVAKILTTPTEHPKT